MATLCIHVHQSVLLEFTTMKSGPRKSNAFYSYVQIFWISAHRSLSRQVREIPDALQLKRLQHAIAVHLNFTYNQWDLFPSYAQSILFQLRE